MPETVTKICYDETGDVVMTDVDDVPTVQAITSDLSKARASSTTPRKSLPFDLLKQRLPTDINGLFIVDTNFAISHLSIVKGLVDRYPVSKSLVLIPWVVVQELDGLKTASSSYGQANLATLARNAVRYIYECLSAAKVGLRGQKMGESLVANEYGDDAILDCARYWNEKQGIQSILLSNDKNLCTKLMIHGLGAISHEPGLNADAVLKRVINNWKFDITSDRAPSVGEAASAGDNNRTVNMDTQLIDDDLAPDQVLPTQTDTPDMAEMEMDTDPIVAPFYSRKLVKEDPFEKLSAKAGSSRYEQHCRPIPVKSRSQSPESRRRDSVTSSRGRSHSPIMDRYHNADVDMHIDDSKLASTRKTSRRDSVVSDKTEASRNAQGRDQLKDILTNLKATIISAFPALIHDQLMKELQDESSVDFLMQDSIVDVHDLSKRLIDNWMTLPGDALPRGAGKNTSDYIKALSIDLTHQLRNNTPQQSKVLELVTGWAEVWRALSNNIRDQKYIRKRDKYVSQWLVQLT